MPFLRHSLTSCCSIFVAIYASRYVWQSTAVLKEQLSELVTLSFCSPSWVVVPRRWRSSFELLLAFVVNESEVRLPSSSSKDRRGTPLFLRRLSSISSDLFSLRSDLVGHSCFPFWGEKSGSTFHVGWGASKVPSCLSWRWHRSAAITGAEQRLTSGYFSRKV